MIKNYFKICLRIAYLIYNRLTVILIIVNYYQNNKMKKKGKEKF